MMVIDYSSHEWWLVYLTAALALITLGLAVYTAFLWSATKKMVAGAENSSKKQLRAYVFLDPQKEFTLVKPPSISQTVELEMHLKNLGATPAHDVICNSWMTIDVWPLPKDFSFLGPPGEPTGGTFIPPGGFSHFHTGTARPLTESELDSVQKGKLCLYIYGNIKYTDVFGRKHWTNFSFASTSLGREGFKTAVAKTERHNDADRN